MKKRKFVVVGCLVVAFVIVLIAQSHGAQTFRAPGITPERIDISVAKNEFMQCIDASNLTLSQNDLANLQIVSGVLNDPYCCEKEAISEERRACLSGNVTTLEYIYVMLRKTSSDKGNKCYSESQTMSPLVCLPTRQPPGLSGKISNLADCVKTFISGIGIKYETLTSCQD